MPASWPLASAQLRHVTLTGQPRQISFAVLTWARADLASLSGKNSSGSASRQAAAARQFSCGPLAGAVRVGNVVMAGASLVACPTAMPEP